MGVWSPHHNDFDSVKMWAMARKNDVIDLLFIRYTNTMAKRNDTQYRYNGVIAMDATFGTNVSKYQLFSL